MGPDSLNCAVLHAGYGLPAGTIAIQHAATGIEVPGRDAEAQRITGFHRISVSRRRSRATGDER